MVVAFIRLSKDRDKPGLIAQRGGAGGMFKRQRNHPVAEGEGSITSISRPDRRAVAAHRIAVGNIIMNEGGIMQKLDGGGPGLACLGIDTEAAPVEIASPARIILPESSKWWWAAWPSVSAVARKAVEDQFTNTPEAIRNLWGGGCSLCCSLAQVFHWNSPDYSIQ